MALLSLPRWPAGKVMLTIFWDERGVILEHYIPWGNTLTSTTCADILVNHLRPAMKSKRNGFLSDGVRLQHGNAWPYTARTTTATIKDLHFLYLPMFASPRPKWFPPVWTTQRIIGRKIFSPDEEVPQVEREWLRTWLRIFFSCRNPRNL